MNHLKPIGLIMAAEAFTVRTESNIVNQLDDIAQSLDRSRNYLVNQAIKEYINVHGWQIDKVKKGIEAADNEELTDHSSVMNEMKDLIASKVIA